MFWAHVFDGALARSPLVSGNPRRAQLPGTSRRPHVMTFTIGRGIFVAWHLEPAGSKGRDINVVPLWREG